MHIPHITQLPSNALFVENLNKFRVFVGVDKEANAYMPSSPIVVSPQLSLTLVVRHMYLNEVLKYPWLKVLLKQTEFLGLDGISRLKRLAHELNHDGFKDLKHLQVKGCNDMQCILSTDRLIGMTAFPNLESLSLSYMNMLKIICDGVATPGMFSNLRNVSLKSLAGLEMYALPMDLARRLTSIEVEDCRNLNFIFSSNACDREDRLCTATVLPSLKKLILKNLPKLHNLFGEASSSTLSDHPQVCQHLLHKKILLPSLEELELDDVPFRELWDSPPNDDTCITGDGSKVHYFESLGKLKHVTIKSCDKLESLGLPSVAAHLLHLETLYIHRCTKMSEVLTKETDGERPKRFIIFPKLRDLKLYVLVNLKSFYGGTHQLRFTALKNLGMETLPCMISVAVSGNSTVFFNEKIEFPCLEDLSMWFVKDKVDEVKELWRPLVAEGVHMPILNPLPQLRKLALCYTRGLRLISAIAFQQLSILELDTCDNKYVFSTSTPPAEEIYVVTQSQAPQLENLVLNGDSFMEGLFENENDAAVGKICGQLRRLKLWNMQNLKLVPLHLFENLRSLDLFWLKWECVFTSELVTKGVGLLFPVLEELRIDGFDDMKIILDDESGAEAIDFPRLKRIKLTSVRKARSFNYRPESTLHFPSLEELEIWNTDFQSLFSGLVIAPKLRTINLGYCSTMMTVFNAPELPTLQSFTTFKCPDLQSFSVGPLEAPLLNQVCVDNWDYPMEHIDLSNHPINNFLSYQHEERILEEERRQKEKEETQE